MFSSISISPEVAQPHIISQVMEDEGKTVGARGDPASRGAHQTMLDKHRLAMATPPWGYPVELDDIAILCFNFMNLSLKYNLKSIFIELHARLYKIKA